MIESLPSKRIAYVDIPEVVTFDGKFVYSFFTPDERVNDSGLDSPEFIKTRPAGKFDNVFVDSINFRRFTPRFVRFSWAPTVDEKRSLSVGNDNVAAVSIRNNLQKIHNEQTFTTDEYTNVYLQDTGADEKVDFFIRRIIEEIRDRQDPENEESPLDIVRFLRKNISRRVSPAFLTDTFFNLARNGYMFLDERTREITADNILKEISQVRVRTQLNNKVIKLLIEDLTESVEMLTSG